MSPIESVIANPMSGYPEYWEKRSSWFGRMTAAVIELVLDDGTRGYGFVGGGKGELAPAVLNAQMRQLLIGRDVRETASVQEQLYRASIAYGRGGTEPTVTDANVVLGRLDPGAFLGGLMRLDLDGARAAIIERIAKPLGVDVETAADGILRLTNTKLGAAIRLSLFEKGLDPREFTLIAFGGAAGLHAVDVAEELGVRRVIFPRDASTLSAFGILNSDLQHDLVRSRLVQLTPDAVPGLAPLVADLGREASARLDADAIVPANREVRFTADLRYRGQAFELTVPMRGGTLDTAAVEHLIADFHAMHRQRFSYANPGAAVELVSLRATAIGRLTAPSVRSAALTGAGRPGRSRPLWLGGQWQACPVWQRSEIDTATTIPGPALIEEAYTTVIVSPGWTCGPAIGGHLVARKD